MAQPQARQARAPQGQFPPPVEGWVLLRYVGGNHGGTTWHGPVTAIRYYFAGHGAESYVDPRDVDGLLGMRDHGNTVFALAQPVKVAAVIRAADDAAAKETADKEAAAKLAAEQQAQTDEERRVKALEAANKLAEKLGEREGLETPRRTKK